MDLSQICQDKLPVPTATLAPPRPPPVVSRPPSSKSLFLSEMDIERCLDGIQSRVGEVPAQERVLMAGKMGLPKAVSKVMQMNQIAKEERAAEVKPVEEMNQDGNYFLVEPLG